MKQGERFLKDQLKFLVDQLQHDCINISQFMTLMAMVHSDWIEFFPEEKPEYYDKRRIKQQLSDFERECGIISD